MSNFKTALFIIGIITQDDFFLNHVISSKFFQIKDSDNNKKICFRNNPKKRAHKLRAPISKVIQKCSDSE